MGPVLDAVALADRLHEPDAAADLVADPLLAVDLKSVAALAPPDAAALRTRLATVPAVTVGIGDAPRVVGSAARALTTIAAPGDLAAIGETVAANPRASIVLDRLLRLTERLAPADGVAAEAFAYSTLLAGEEFARWREAQPARADPNPGRSRVALRRDGGTLRIELAHPEVHNAFDVAMRDELAAALDLAARAPDIHRVVLTGAGPSFCSGGALWDFGTAPDAATAAAVRLARPVGLLLHRLAPRATVRLHGACIGAGVELAAFAGHVRAASDTRAALPEVGMGLVPGAGGTVSLTRRAGRQRVAWLALTGATVDAATLHDWGVVDELDP